MKILPATINWKNFLQRTLLFLFLFVFIRYMVDVFEDEQPSLLRILRISLVRYLVFAMILGLLDSDTWQKAQTASENQEPLRFGSFFKAFLHYGGVAVIVALVCGAILLVFFLIQWAVNYATGKIDAAFFPNWQIYLLVIVIIGACFALFDAFQNFRRLQKRR
jgi:branched-subunit amino acid transport protein